MNSFVQSFNFGLNTWIKKKIKCKLNIHRSLTGRWRRGGNASNICSVLRQFSENCEFIGSLSKSKVFQFLIEDCNKQKICIDHCVYHENCGAPFSSVILNEANGSRTIIHSNTNLPILTIEDFQKIPFERYKWIHFEVNIAPNSFVSPLSIQLIMSFLGPKSRRNEKNDRFDSAMEWKEFKQ